MMGEGYGRRVGVMGSIVPLSLFSRWVLEGENAVQRNRDLMGATNPADAELGTIRRDFATSIDANAVHGSDSLENTATDIAFSFGDTLA